MTIHSEGITDADLDRFEKVAEPIYRSTATAGEASRFQVSDLGMWIIRLVGEVRRLRVARPTLTGEEREVLARLVHDETGEAEEESGFVADAILAAFEVRLKAHTPTDDERDALLVEADALVASWDQKGSWSSDSPVGMVMRLATALRRSEVYRSRAARGIARCPASGTATRRAGTPSASRRRPTLNWRSRRANRPTRRTPAW